MRHLIAAAALAASLIVAPTAASAQAGWYVRGDAGYSVDGSLELGGQVEPSFDEDWMGALGVGHAYGNGFRAEGELSYRTNDLEADGAVTGVDVDATALMLNGYYDFLRGSRLRPYVGVGIGAAQIEPTIAIGAARASDDDTLFAWQAMAGVSVGLTERLALDVGYRYFRGEDGEFGRVGSGEDFSTIEGDYEHQAVTAGLRFSFGAPAAAAPVAAVTPPPAQTPRAAPPPTAPPPPAPPQACPARDFVVYFEWDRSSLNQAALDTLDAAVAQARACNIAAIQIAGHTDTSGSTQYNDALSARRASVVRDGLVARGLAAASIQVRAAGEREPAQATRDGVREPLNRRASVAISFR